MKVFEDTAIIPKGRRKRERKREKEYGNVSIFGSAYNVIFLSPLETTRNNRRGYCHFSYQHTHTHAQLAIVFDKTIDHKSLSRGQTRVACGLEHVEGGLVYV